MNTPSHVLLGLALLGRRGQPRRTGAIVAGAVLPDVPIFVLFAVATFVWRVPQREIWSRLYFQPEWQVAVDLAHSLPLVAVGLALAIWQRWPRVQALCASAGLHSLTDLPLHADDGHRHFYPLSTWRYESPVSYWDPRHHGIIAMRVELLLMAALCVWLVWRTSSRRGRAALWLTAAAYAAMLGVSLAGVSGLQSSVTK